MNKEEMSYETFVEKMREAGTTVVPVGQYSGLDAKMQFYCTRCENTFTATPAELLSTKKARCPICKRRKFSHAELVEKIQATLPDVEILGPVARMGGKVKARCKKDGHEWHPFVYNLFKGEGCPKCKNRLKITEEQFRARIAETLPDIEILGSFTKMTDRIDVRCKTCGKTWNPIAQSLYRGHGCLKCAGKEQKTTEEVKAELADLRPDVLLLGKYESALKPVLYRFTGCGHECVISTAHIKSGRGCPECAKALNGASQRHNNERLQQMLDERFGDIEVVGEYVNNTTPILFRCRRCGHEWMARPMDVKASRGCPECNKAGTSFLQEFIYAFMAHALPDGSVLSRDRTAIGKELDIYVPSAGLAIEPGSWYWHRGNVANDEEKARLCRDAGIELVTLYDHYDGDTPPFSGAVVTKNDLGDPVYFDELVEICHGFLAKVGVTAVYTPEEILAIKAEAYRASLGATPALYKEEVERVNPNIEIVGEYSAENNTVSARCRVCGYEWEPAAGRLRTPTSCPRCTGHYHWSHDKFVDELAKKHPFMAVMGKYKNQNTPLRVRCTRRHEEHNYMPGYLLSKYCCRRCAKERDKGTDSQQQDEPKEDEDGL